MTFSLRTREIAIEKFKARYTATVVGPAWWIATEEGTQHMAKLKQWCRDQFGEPSEGNWQADMMMFTFATAEQLILFKLAWS